MHFRRCFCAPSRPATRWPWPATTRWRGFTFCMATRTTVSPSSRRGRCSSTWPTFTATSPTTNDPAPATGGAILASTGRPCSNSSRGTRCLLALPCATFSSPRPVQECHPIVTGQALKLRFTPYRSVPLILATIRANALLLERQAMWAVWLWTSAMSLPAAPSRLSWMARSCRPSTSRRTEQDSVCSGGTSNGRYLIGLIHRTRAPNVTARSRTPSAITCFSFTARAERPRRTPGRSLAHATMPRPFTIAATVRWM